MVENNLEGFENIVNWFRKIILEHEYKDVLVGMESTGTYWLNLVHYLKYLLRCYESAACEKKQRVGRQLTH